MAPADPKAATIAAAVRHATAALRAAGIDTPSLDARLLVAEALGMAHDRLLSVGDAAIPARAQASIDAMIARRSAGEPVSRILGHREFWGRPFKISPATLDPRPETETLVEIALAILTREGLQAPRLIDIGTGSGCILLTLLAELPRATGTATDISIAALEAARDNAGRLGVSDRLELRHADLLEGIEGPFDMLLSNPPYIRTADIAGLAPEVARFDPLRALDGGPDGLAFYRRIVRDAARVVPGGWVVLEVGHDQAAAVVALAEAAGAIAYGTASTHMDLSGQARCVAWKTQV